jgi:hypothetical protein
MFTFDGLVIIPHRQERLVFYRDMTVGRYVVKAPIAVAKPLSKLEMQHRECSLVPFVLYPGRLELLRVWPVAAKKC